MIFCVTHLNHYGHYSDNWVSSHGHLANNSESATSVCMRLIIFLCVWLD